MNCQNLGAGAGVRPQQRDGQGREPHCHAEQPLYRDSVSGGFSSTEPDASLLLHLPSDPAFICQASVYRGSTRCRDTAGTSEPRGKRDSTKQEFEQTGERRPVSPQDVTVWSVWAAGGPEGHLIAQMGKAATRWTLACRVSPCRPPRPAVLPLPGAAFSSLSVASLEKGCLDPPQGSPPLHAWPEPSVFCLVWALGMVPPRCSLRMQGSRESPFWKHTLFSALPCHIPSTRRGITGPLESSHLIMARMRGSESALRSGGQVLGEDSFVVRDPTGQMDRMQGLRSKGLGHHLVQPLLPGWGGQFGRKQQGQR